jgi:hypothetical protein
VSENKALKGIFGPKRVEMTGGWRKLNNKELHNVRASPVVIIMMNDDEMGRTCRTHGDEECI